MEEEKNINEQIETLATAWTNAVTDTWGSIFKTWTHMSNMGATQSTADETPMGIAENAWATTLKTWEIFSSTSQKPETMESMFKGIGTLPEILAKMSQTMMNSFFQLQSNWVEKAKDMGKTFETLESGDISENMFQAWKELYHKDIRQYLNVPQLGLTRFHQERMLQTVDKYNIFQTTFSEFLRMLYLPINRSLSVMEDKIKTLAQDDKLPEDSKSYYRMWIKVLESDYMKLFKSAEYMEVLGRTVDSLTEFSKAKNRLMEDYLSLFQVPKLSDIDDLYHEIYLLKKKIKKLEKKEVAMGNAKVPVDQILSKLAEDVESFQTRTQKASKVLLENLNTSIATTPYDVVYEEDRIKLKHYRTKGDRKLKTPLLVVYALINRETMLDLQPGRSVVQTFLDSGIDLYMVDWGYPSRKDRFLTIDDHVNGYMDNIIDYIREQHGVQKLNLMGICMGGTFSIIYSALHPEKIKNLVTTVTPSNFDTDKGLLHLWTQKLDADKITDTYGNLAGDFLNFGFLLLNPARLMIDKYIGFIDQMDNKSFIENFVRMEKWIFDSPDLPGETFRQFIKDCYQQNLLIQSKMKVGDQRVELKKVTMPLLNIYAKYDHLVPPEACELLTKSVGTKDATDVCLDTGHIGIYVSSKCQQEFAPRIADWLKERDNGRKVKRSKATKKASAKPKTKSGPSPKKNTNKK